MKTTKNQNPDPLFAVQITDTTDLGLAILIAESEEGHYEIVSPVATVGEAREIASDDMASRHRRLAKGDAPLSPYVYKFWARGIDGRYHIAFEFGATD